MRHHCGGKHLLPLLAALLLLTGGCARTPAEGGGPAVNIYLGEALYASLPFSEPDVVTVDQGDGRVNEVTLTGEGVYVSHATCENQECVKQGQITAENYTSRLLHEWILCLPNGVTVEFVPGAEQ